MLFEWVNHQGGNTPPGTNPKQFAHNKRKRLTAGQGTQPSLGRNTDQDFAISSTTDLEPEAIYPLM